MNGGLGFIFHSPVQYSFAVVVNELWNLCKAGT